MILTDGLWVFKMESDNKKTLDEYYMDMAKLVASRSTSPHRKVGAVLVSEDGYVIATGYNGAPIGEPHETSIGCEREKLKAEGTIKSGERFELCSEVHAEVNCIVQVALSGASCRNGTVYTTASPCLLCARVLINAHIKRVFYSELYDESALSLIAGHCLTTQI